MARLHRPRDWSVRPGDRRTVGISRAFPIAHRRAGPARGSRAGQSFAKEKLAPLLSMFTVRRGRRTSRVPRILARRAQAIRRSFIAASPSDRTLRAGHAGEPDHRERAGRAGRFGGHERARVPPMCSAAGPGAATRRPTTCRTATCKTSSGLPDSCRRRREWGASCRRPRQWFPVRVGLPDASGGRCAISHFRDCPCSVISGLFQGFWEPPNRPCLRQRECLGGYAGAQLLGARDYENDPGASAAALIWAMLTVAGAGAIARGDRRGRSRRSARHRIHGLCRNRQADSARHERPPRPQLPEILLPGDDRRRQGDRGQRLEPGDRRARRPHPGCLRRRQDAAQLRSCEQERRQRVSRCPSRRAAALLGSNAAAVRSPWRLADG